MENMQNILQISNISKRYPGVMALDRVSFDIPRNVVHCIMGENGAGKSTLIKILTGAIERTEGTIVMAGQEYSPKNIRDAMNSGISVLYQELNVVDELTVEQNLTLGIEESRFGVIKTAERTKQIYKVMNEIDPAIDLKQKVEKLSVGKKQIIEIAKAVASNARILIMDEPTAALSEEEVRRLFVIINRLRTQDVTVIYISHRLEEIFEIGDYVTVLRDGKCVGTKHITEFESQQELIQMMLGKIIVQSYQPNQVDYSHKVMEVRNICNHKLKNISFTVHRGEVVGFYGLVGAGKTEIARALFGADACEGEMILDEKEVKIKDPGEAIRMGISMVPEERRTQGLFLGLSVKENIPLMNYRRISRFGVYDKRKLKNMALRYIRELKIATSDEEKPVALLSGGNQQKVVLAKCLNAESKIMLLDEPSRGVDIGAKDEIFGIIRKLSKDGVSSIVFSSELPEILALCDTIYLLYEGEIKARLCNSIENKPDSEYIMNISTGGQDSDYDKKDK